jgi:hypothetical protein
MCAGYADAHLMSAYLMAPPALYSFARWQMVCGSSSRQSCVTAAHQAWPDDEPRHDEQVPAFSLLKNRECALKQTHCTLEEN